MPAPGRPRRRVHRAALMLALPLLLASAGAYVWVTGGRFVSTENAFVHQDKIQVAAEVTGRIVGVGVEENEPVRAGQVLFRIDPEPYRYARDQAEAALEAARLEVEQLRSAYRESLEARRAAEQDLEFRQREYRRQDQLAKNGYAAQAKFDEARNALQAAQQKVAVAEQSAASALTALGGDPDIRTDRHPKVLEAAARLRKAKFDLAHAVVAAPHDGVVSQTASLQVGQYVAAGTPVMSLVQSGCSWVEANVKETDLTYMQVGQEATVELDAYPGRPLRARIESIGAGTGAEFALLPAQNASGNWVKVVQRVPVRLSFAVSPAGVPLRAGLSAEVTIDTGHVRGLPSPIRSALAAAGLGRDAAPEQAPQAVEAARQ
jgi:membrane fusion protein (multidrug efflux system)